MRHAALRPERRSCRLPNSSSFLHWVVYTRNTGKEAARLYRINKVQVAARSAEWMVHGQPPTPACHYRQHTAGQECSQRRPTTSRTAACSAAAARRAGQAQQRLPAGHCRSRPLLRQGRAEQWRRWLLAIHCRGKPTGPSSCWHRRSGAGREVRRRSREGPRPSCRQTHHPHR